MLGCTKFRNKSWSADVKSRRSPVACQSARSATPKGTFKEKDLQKARTRLRPSRSLSTSSLQTMMIKATVQPALPDGRLAKEILPEWPMGNACLIVLHVQIHLDRFQAVAGHLELPHELGFAASWARIVVKLVVVS